MCSLHLNDGINWFLTFLVWIFAEQTSTEISMPCCYFVSKKLRQLLKCICMLRVFSLLSNLWIIYFQSLGDDRKYIRRFCRNSFHRAVCTYNKKMGLFRWGSRLKVHKEAVQMGSPRKAPYLELSWKNSILPQLLFICEY